MNIKRLENANNMTNIPHMLRNLAAEFEGGSERMPETLLVIGVHGANDFPELYHFGRDDRVLVDAAALMATAQRMTATTVEKA